LFFHLNQDLGYTSHATFPYLGMKVKGGGNGKTIEEAGFLEGGREGGSEKFCVVVPHYPIG
jgi:hypothetical protein